MIHGVLNPIPNSRYTIFLPWFLVWYNLEKGVRGELMGFLVIAILLVYLYDFTKLRKQNQTIIEQNEKVISLLEEIKNK